MIKKLIFIFLPLILVIGLIIGYIHLTPKQLNPTANLTSSAAVEIESRFFPSLEKLKEEKGVDLKDLGQVQISTVIFQDVNQAVLTTDKSDEIKVPLSVTSKEKQEFSLSTIEYTPEDLHIGDTFGLAELDSHYYAYELK